MKYFILVTFIFSFCSILIVCERQYQFKIHCENPLKKIVTSTNLATITHDINHVVRYMEDIGYADYSNGIYVQSENAHIETNSYNKVKLAQVQLSLLPDTLTRKQKLTCINRILSPLKSDKNIENIYNNVQLINFSILFFLTVVSIFYYKVRGF